MTDMFTGMPFYWTGAAPTGAGPINYQANIAQQQAANQALSQQTTANSANIEAQSQAFMNAARAQNNAAYNQAVQFAMLNSSTGGSKPAGTYSPGSGLSSFSGKPLGGGGNVFDYGTSAFNPYGGAGGFQTFDPGKYYQKNPDVWSAGADAWKHYNQFGKNEGREGTWGDFDTAGYLSANPDVKAAGVDPTAHWFQFGAKEGRQGSGLSPLNSYQGTGFDAFDTNIYGGSHPTAGFGEQPKASTPKPDWGDLWKERGPYQRGAETNSQRDDLAAAYYANNRDVYDAAVKSGQNMTDFGLNHIMAYGGDEGRSFFDFNKYRQDNPDVAASGMDPTAHWFQYGQKEGRTMPQSSVWNDETYKLLNPDVAKAGVDPLQHWLQFGQKENRMGGAFESGLMYDQFKGSTYREPWVAGIPEARRTNETVTAMKNLAQQYGWDPAALAAVIQMETKNSKLTGENRISSDSLWNTLTKTGQYHGLTQMGPGTFADAGGKLNGMTYEQYKKATPAQQIATYGAWLNQGAKVGPGTAASLVKGGIGSLPPEMQASIMMGTQFGPNTTGGWVTALGEGNMNVPTSTKQAPELAPWTIEAMRNVFANEMAAWPQNQSPWPLK